MNFKVNFTETAAICMEEVESFKRQNIGAAAAADFTDTLLEGIIEGLSNNPERHQVCPELLDLGVTSIRERNTPDGYRTLFEVNESSVYVLAVLHQRQSIQDTLFRHMILR